MNNVQYTIGEFASMNKVSTRMLRHYDKIGLLQPASIQQNGYRSYNEKQISAISQIKRLRGCGFLLEEIDAILQHDNPQFLAEEAKRKIVDLQGQAAKHQTAIHSLRELAQEKDSVVPLTIYGVSLIVRNETNLLVLSRSVTLNDVEDAFSTMFQFLYKKRLHAAGCAVLLNRLDCPDENQNQVGVPILETYQDKCYQTFLMPSAPMLSVIHYGDYYNIGHAYSAILKYAEQNGYIVDAACTERYLIDSSHGAQPNEYVTEISIALKNTP